MRGTYLNLKVIHNTNRDFKKINPDIQMKKAKKNGKYN